jgi:iron complex outermembrane receptor protein
MPVQPGATTPQPPPWASRRATPAAFNARSHSTPTTTLDLTAMASYTASPSYAIEFGYAHKVRSPNVYERFTWSTWQMAALMNNFVGDGNGYFGNLALKPESGQHAVSHL